MQGLPTAVIGKWLGHRGGVYTPTEGVNSGKSYPWLQIALGDLEFTIDSEKFFFSTDQEFINESNIEKEEKAYLNQQVKLTGLMVMKDGKPRFIAQQIEEYKTK